MKRLFFSLYFVLCTLYLCSAQAVLYNGGTDITADAGSIIYVDGDVINSLNGTIHNQGDIYLTKNWTNHHLAGCLDPTTGTVILDGASTQTITGSASTTFNNLDCRKGSKKKLYIDTYVGGNTGVLMLKSSPFELNSNTLMVTNPLPGAITRTSGYIISETEPVPGYGTVEWRIKNASAGTNYTYPFGTNASVYVPFVFNVKTAGVQSSTGAMAVSTYPTNVTASPNNRPLPTGVSNLNDLSNAANPEAGPICADRFWITDPLNYTTKPTADIIFTYTDAEWNTLGGSTNKIFEDSLRAWRWTGSQWQLPAVGTGNPATNQVTVKSVNTFTQWTLMGEEPPPPPPCGDFFLPNAFSPNSDGMNDYFKPRNNCIASLDFKIYNRWGNLVYWSTSPADPGWDGSTFKTKDGSVAVYSYILFATLQDGTHYDKKGTVTLLK